MGALPPGSPGDSRALGFDKGLYALEQGGCDPFDRHELVLVFERPVLLSVSDDVAGDDRADAGEGLELLEVCGGYTDDRGLGTGI